MDNTVVAFFNRNGAPATGLSPTIRIWAVENASNTLVVADDPMTEIGDGFYKYVFTSIDPLLDYVVRTDGGSSLCLSERYGIGASELSKEEIGEGVWDVPATNYPATGSPQTMGTQLNLTTQNTIDILDFAELLIAAEYNRAFVDKNAATLTIYASDQVTPIRVFSLRDSNGVPSITEIADRIPISGSPLVIPLPSP